MTFIHNLRISLKITLCAAGDGRDHPTVAVNGSSSSDRHIPLYSELIANKMVPAIRLAQANRRVLEMGLRSYQVIAYAPPRRWARTRRRRKPHRSNRRRSG